MRRTHVTHTRDNRRPQYLARHDRDDRRPVLEWRRGFPRDAMILDGREVATVEPVDDGFVAVVPSADGNALATKRTEWDEARLFCEAALSAQLSALSSQL